VKNAPLHIGYQWGEPPNGESTFVVKRSGDDLEITASTPRYASSGHPCDLIRQYEGARKNRSIGKQRTGKDSPHVRFANAANDEDLIEFVRAFGPVVSPSWTIRPHRVDRVREKSSEGPSLEMLIKAKQNLGELRGEQRLYRALVALIVELARKETEFNFESAQKFIMEVAEEIRRWPEQWIREKKQLGGDPLWTIRQNSLRQIESLTHSKRDVLLPPQVDARIVVCEALNAFPPRIFPNPLQMHWSLQFGVRPLLYSLLRAEFFQTREVRSCGNTPCRSFFEVERAGQNFCNEICSRQQRQREYWQIRGKNARLERRAKD